MKQIISGISMLFLYTFLLVGCNSLKTVSYVPQSSEVEKVEKTADSKSISLTPTPKNESNWAYVSNQEILSKDLKKSLFGITQNDTTIDEALKQALFNKRLLLEAHRKGYDTDPEFTDELNSYKDILAESYLTDSITIKYLLKEAYDWMHYEVRAGHIMYNLPEFAEPRDTLAIYNKLLEIRQKAIAGEDFQTLSKTYSQDKKTNYLGGNLGWFTALQLVYPIEKVAYNTQVGQISMPFRSKGGYHILKVYEKRPYSGEVQVRNLMKFVPTQSPDSLKIKAKIDSIYVLLKNGGNFEELCQKLSDDKSNKNFGGILAKFKVGTREESFEKAAFALNIEGEISQPVRTEAGWHILKLVKKFPLESYEAIYPKLKDKVVTDSRGDVVKENTIARLKKELSFKENLPIVRAAIAEADTNLLKKKWYYTLDDTLLLKPFITIDTKIIKTRDFFDYVIERQKLFKIPAGYTANSIMRNFYKNFVDNQIKTYSEVHLEEHSEDFKALMNEYHESLLTTRLMNERVFDKSVADTTGQRAYYEMNKSKFPMPERVFASIISTSDAKYFQQIREILTKGTPYQLKRGIQPIYFDKFVTELSAEQKQSLVRLLALLRKQTSYIVEVAGNASDIETDNVSAERLKNVVNFLVKNGLPITRIIENNLIKTKPESKIDISKNQRVSFQFFSNSKQDLEKTLNTRNPNAVSIVEGYFKHGENQYLDVVTWQKGIHLIEMDNKKFEINIEKIEPQRSKTLREVRGEVIKAYQAILEQQFKAELEQRFPIKLDDAEANKILEEAKKQ